MWSSLLLLAGSIIVVLLIGWRVRRYLRDVGDQSERDYRDPPLFHDRAAPH